jgi:ApaG protein
MTSPITIRTMNKALPVSDTTTDDIRVVAEPEYIPGIKAADVRAHLFSYRITITNNRLDSVQLLSRRWLILNSEGDESMIEGEGVVGYQPILEPGESFTYSSYCPIDTEWGTMEGTFRFLKVETATHFDVLIGRMFLRTPDSIESPKR